jgi:HTH-type transcriptional regulator/antitoxin HigA
MEQIKSIETEKEYDDLMVWVDAQFDIGVRKGTEEGNNLEQALLLIKEYEDKNYQIDT